MGRSTLVSLGCWWVVAACVGCSTSDGHPPRYDPLGGPDGSWVRDGGRFVGGSTDGGDASTGPAFTDPACTTLDPDAVYALDDNGCFGPVDDLSKVCCSLRVAQLARGGTPTGVIIRPGDGALLYTMAFESSAGRSEILDLGEVYRFFPDQEHWQGGSTARGFYEWPFRDDNDELVPHPCPDGEIVKWIYVDRSTDELFFGCSNAGVNEGPIYDSEGNVMPGDDRPAMVGHGGVQIFMDQVNHIGTFDLVARDGSAVASHTLSGEVNRFLAARQDDDGFLVALERGITLNPGVQELWHVPANGDSPEKRGQYATLADLVVRDAVYARLDGDGNVVASATIGADEAIVRVPLEPEAVEVIVRNPEKTDFRVQPPVWGHLDTGYMVSGP